MMILLQIDATKTIKYDIWEQNSWEGTFYNSYSWYFFTEILMRSLSLDEI